MQGMSYKAHKNSFTRNIQERTDTPVFTTEEAIRQMREKDTMKTQIENEMDKFFMKNLPKKLTKQPKDKEIKCELNYDSVRQNK